MKVYQADNGLQEVLLKQGFANITSEKEAQKGLQIFKLSKADKKSIVLEGQSIKILPEGTEVNKLSEEELKIVLLYCQLITNDFKEISPKGKLDFETCVDSLKSLKVEFTLLLVTEGKSTKKIKLSRVFEALSTIESSLIN